MASLHGASKELQELEERVQNRTDWKYEMRREAQEILPGTFKSGCSPYTALREAYISLSQVYTSVRFNQAGSARRSTTSESPTSSASPRQEKRTGLAYLKPFHGQQLTLRIPSQTYSQAQVPGRLCLPHPGHPRRRRPELDPYLSSVSFLANFGRCRIVLTIRTSLRRACSFIEGALAHGGRVLVHCGDGISRSPAIVCVVIPPALGCTSPQEHPY